MKMAESTLFWNGWRWRHDQGSIRNLSRQEAVPNATSARAFGAPSVGVGRGPRGCGDLHRLMRMGEGDVMRPEADMYDAERESVDRTIPDEPEYHGPGCSGALL